MLQAENIRSARCLRVVLSETARCSQSKFFISARARKKNRSARMLENARKDHSSPLFLDLSRIDLVSNRKSNKDFCC